MGPVASRSLTKGIFVVLEGIDGTGKTTQLALLAEKYQEAGFPVVRTREPTDGIWGKQIREIAAKGRDHISPEYELDLFLKDREEHVANVIEPALRARNIVLSDRYYYSTIAYQSAIGIDPDHIRRRNEELFPKPDVVILLDARPEVGISRIVQGRREKNNQGFEQQAYLEEVRKRFKELRSDPLVREIDSTRPAQTVFRDIALLTDKLVKQHLTAPPATTLSPPDQ